MQDERGSRDYRRKRICGALPGLDVDWLEAGPSRANVSNRRFAGTDIVETTDPPTAVGRRAPPGAPDGGYKLVLHLAGGGYYRHPGGDLEQSPGDLMLLDTMRPFQAAYPNGAHVLVWGLPREALAPLVAGPHGGHACGIPGDEGMGAVLGDYVRTLATRADQLSREEQRNLLTHLCTLVALTLGSTPGVGEPRRAAYRTLQRQRILSYLETHLREPRLSAERAAHELGMSRRWLEVLLADGGESFSTRIANRRIEESRKLLRDPTLDHLSIAEIGFLVGFNDVSTFHRRFRRRYGITPRDTRSLHRTQ